MRKSFNHHRTTSVVELRLLKVMQQPKIYQLKLVAVELLHLQIIKHKKNFTDPEVASSY